MVEEGQEAGRAGWQVHHALQWGGGGLATDAGRYVQGCAVGDGLVLQSRCPCIRQTREALHTHCSFLQARCFQEGSA